MSTGKKSAAKPQPMFKGTPTELNALSMITEAIIALNDRQGVFRDSIWKYMKMKYEKATATERSRKIFMARLKKFADEGTHIVYAANSRGRFRLEPNFRTRLATRKAKGMETKAASEHAILRKSFNPKKKATKNKKNTRAKTAKGRAKNSKQRTKAQKAKDTKRRTKAAEKKTKAAKGAAGKGAAKPKAKDGRKPSRSPARKPSTSPAKGKKPAQGKGKSPAKGGRKASASPAKGRKASASPAKGKGKK